MPFQRSCLYHLTQPFRVIEENNEEEYKQLKASGEWFDLPTEVKEHEEQIRREPRKRSKNGKRAPVENGSGTLIEERVCKEGAIGTSKTSGEIARS